MIHDQTRDAAVQWILASPVQTDACRAAKGFSSADFSAADRGWSASRSNRQATRATA